MQSVAVLALVIGIVMLFRWLGPPVRQSSEDKKSNAQNPEADLPPPTPPIIS